MVITALVRSFFVAMLSRSLGKHGLINIRVEGLGDTFTIGTGQKVFSCTFVFDGPLALGLFVASPRLLMFAKLYIDGHISVEGDWFEAANIVNQLDDKGGSTFEWLIGHLAPKPSVNVHYGWSAEAFACFLDPYMQYTGGRQDEVGGQLDLAASQLNKLELIAQWVGAQPGQRHLDIGCGWGGLILYFVKRYGTVSHGVTLAPEQAAYAKEQVPEAEFFVTGFEGHTPPEPYDFVTVVGMLEHVPIARHAEFFAYLATRLRKKNGRVYLQCITRSPTRAIGDRTRVLNAYVFKHELNTLENLQKLAEEAGFEVAKVEEGHADYALTTRQWVEHLHVHEAETRQLLADDKVYRTLLGYLTMGSLSFAAHHMNLHRLLLVKK